jgi:hypothetical protein
LVGALNKASVSFAHCVNNRGPALLLLVAPALTMVLALFVYPLALSLVSAFTVRDGRPGVDNFIKALELYGIDIVFTFVIVGVSTVLVGVLAAAIGGYLVLGAHPAAVAVGRNARQDPLRERNYPDKSCHCEEPPATKQSRPGWALSPRDSLRSQ